MKPRSLLILAAAAILSACATQDEYAAWETAQAKNKIQATLVDEGCVGVAFRANDGGGNGRANDGGGNGRSLTLNITTAKFNLAALTMKSSCNNNYGLLTDQQVFVTVYDANKQEILAAQTETHEDAFYLSLGHLAAGFTLKIGTELIAIQ